MTRARQVMSLKAHERAWLQELRRRDAVGEPIDHRAMFLALRAKLPAGFRPRDIDESLVRDQHLSVLGIYAIDRSADELRNLERLIQWMRERVLSDGSCRSVTAGEGAKALGLNVELVQRLFVLMSQVSGMWSGGKAANGYGYSEVGLDSVDAVASLLEFRSLDDTIAKAWQDRRTFRALFADAGEGEAASTARRSARVERDSAFLIMNMSRDDALLEDVANGIKDVCTTFGVTARRADDFEHSDRITDLILEQIAVSDLLIADVTGERPNVYYEIGYAHALNKKPIVFRRQGTKLHFDLSVHNVPEYQNVSDLKRQLTSRLEAVLGRSPRKIRDGRRRPTGR